MKFFITVTLIFIGLLHDGTYCTSEDLDENDGIRECYGVSCPKGTVTCTKHSTTTSDLQYIDTVVRCIDNQGNTMKSDQQQRANPFPDVRFSIFSFESGVIGTSGRQPSDATPAYDNKYDQVETF
ncbi:uncharacterized protein LOC108736800 [Agrilus planipennis]|uniref:Uncharacterized protein LOC108736800 n=1 Tax=Agrilus planipennis TaxID=224129 RepID=A0A1W4WLR9_AGRPL|nr:uncharacterized protein LOC108736800 [Agrilus planipennis]